MSRTIDAAVVQTAAHDRASLQSAWPGIAKSLHEAAQRAQLVVLPEGTLPAYVLAYEPFHEAEIAEPLAQCRRIARESRSVIVLGAARRDGDRVFNSALVIDADGSIAGAADKHFLWHFDRQWFAQGERLTPIRTTIGTIGALVCADGRIPAIAAALADRGAELLVMPTAWVTSGRDPALLENIQADLFARVRARENALPFLAANKCGVELGCVAYCGKSQIVAADGSVLAVASQDRTETLYAQIPLGGSRAPRTATHSVEPMSPPERPLRVALGLEHAERIDAQVLRLLEADAYVGGDGSAAGELAPRVPVVGDDTVLDPSGLAQLRLNGGDFALWRTSYDSQWQLAIARTRALELRMYLAVADTSRNRAYAIDPDGTVLCGTFEEYRIAGFTYDPARARNTLVAPGTDVAAGLRRASLHETP